MKTKMIMKTQKGFILFITLIMLIIFAIIGVSLYQQTSMSTVTVQYMSFKQEAEDLAMTALNEIEAGVKSDSSAWPRCVNNDATLCEPIPELAIDSALSNLRKGMAIGQANGRDWKVLDKKGAFSGDGDVHYIIQNLGADHEDLGYRLYRITIIAQVLTSFNVISAVTAVPEDDI